MNSYDLSRTWFDFAFNNPERIKPIHTAIYFFAIEHCNRLGWKKKFGFPTSMVLEATGIKSYSSYKKHFDEIVSFGFFIVHEYSKNQYSSNVIELTLNVKALDKAQCKALDKALQKHSTKHSQSTVSIDKQLNNLTINNLTINNKDAIATLDFSMFDDSSINDLWKEWVDYKFSQHKEKFKSQNTEQTAIKKLAELSNNKTAVAKKIIEQSISNLWKGLFELKNVNTNQNGNNTNAYHKPNITERTNEALERIRREREELFNSPWGFNE